MNNETKLKRLNDKMDILRRQISDLEYTIKQEKQAKCTNHDFEYFCSSHNDSVYRCIKCGLMEER